MKQIKIPPYVVLAPSKEVIFYISKESNLNKDIPAWMKKLDLPSYSGMVINSKCIFNRLKNKDCN
tara:strand:+ start:532 stop:726 length:195 start_codon:yes stop_codon:yes gene_type:complete